MLLDAPGLSPHVVSARQHIQDGASSSFVQIFTLQELCPITGSPAALDFSFTSSFPFSHSHFLTCQRWNVSGGHRPPGSRSEQMSDAPKQRFCGSAPSGVLLSPLWPIPRGTVPARSRTGSGSQGPGSTRPLLGGSRASMRPSVEQVTLAQRTRVHILSLDCKAFNIPSLEKR
ncbi:unnamed protein product [Pleuronectes platessa]|uniref:Uncharacterized protein n=1 Tax=Pleuronectes platessa TaxID=8262 RepID=A0A9N7VAB3_PLEPL|nr:unnamed protein product [Pleuronectes platessa]